ncbi:MAG: hypothetical protein ACFCGT_08695 [Sandaracinaceae bacterium]
MGEPPVEAPLIPWLADGAPVEWPCPPGWQEETEGGLTHCQPYARGGPDDCAAGEAHFPAEADCRPLGRACGEGPFADASDLDPTTVLHVDASAPGGGDGSAGAPFTTLADAFGSAREGTTVVVAAGRYTVDRPWPSGVSLRGRCAAETSLVAPDDVGERTAVIESPEGRMALRIEDVTVGPAPIRGVELRGVGGAVALDALLIRGTTGRGLFVLAGAEAVARDLVVSDTASLNDGTLGRGLDIDEGGQLTLDRGLVRENREVGVLVQGPGTEASLQNVAIVDTQVNGGRLGGFGLAAELGAQLLCERALLGGNQGGVSVGPDGTMATLADVVVLGTRTRGPGLSVFDADLTLERGLLRGNSRHGVFVFGARARVTLTDVAVLDTELDPDGLGGRGLSAQDGSSLTLRRGLVRANRDIGVFVARDATADLADLAIIDTRARGDGMFGWGLAALARANLTVQRAIVRRNRDVGVFLASPGTAATLTDVEIVDTRGTVSDGSGGRGLSVQAGATLSLERGVLRTNRDLGVFIAGPGSRATLTDVAVLDTQSEGNDGTGGRGLNAQQGASLDVERGIVRDNRDVGVFVSDAGTRASLTDVAILSTRAAERGRSAGINVSALVEADVRLQRFVMADADLCGVHIVAGALLRLAHGVVRNHPFGICLETRDYPLELLRNNVRYEANEVRIESRTIDRPVLEDLVDF